jgi:uncharacterized glyoxalase superfamily protein PhnB
LTTPRIVVNDVVRRPADRVGHRGLDRAGFFPGGTRTLPAFLYVYVDDADATCQRAVDAGAEVIETPCNQFYGDRRAW